MKPLLDQSFWSDPEIEACDPTVKLAALWLITNSQTSLIGVCGASVTRFRFETGLPAEALESLLKALPRAFVRAGNSIFVRNYVRHQFGTGDKLMKNNFFVALKSLFLSVKDEALSSLILSEYPEFEQARKGFEGLPKPKDGKEREGEDSEGKDGGSGDARGEGKAKRTRPPRQPIDCPAFAAFWKAYPNKEAKADAEAAWVNHRCATILPRILETLRWKCDSPKWKEDRGKYIPLPATWINRRGWEDEQHASHNGGLTNRIVPNIMRDDE